MDQPRQSWPDPRLSTSRRGLLQAGGAALLAAAGLGACSSGGGRDSAAQNNANARVSLPTYIPFQQVAPDLAPSADGVMAGYVNYPTNLVDVGTTPVLRSGKPITALSQTAAVAPPSVNRNAYWQELNRRIGVELKFNLAPQADYPTKLITALAGDDLPDLVQMLPTSFPRVPRLPEVLRAKFADLTEYLSGDNIKEYPALANIPTSSWLATVYNGGIYGIPIHRGIVGALMLTRQDVLDKLGADSAITSGEEFLELCRQVSDPGKRRWAVGDPRSVFVFVLEMLKGVNVWAERDGRFIRDYEADEYRQALEIVAKMWKEGLFHPDSYAKVGTTTWQALVAGTVVMCMDGYRSWPILMRDFRKDNPELRIGAIPPPAYDGDGLGTQFLSSGIFSITTIKKAEPGRLKELLQVLNFLASPVGTRNALFLSYGIEGQHFTMRGGNPILTPKGVTEHTVPVNYISIQPDILYDSGQAAVTRAQYDYQRKVVPTGVRRAEIGLYSETDSAKGPALDVKMSNLHGDIIQGRQPVSAWAEAVAQWRKDGGDKMRAEYQEARQRAGADK
jgi:putative aldouronate transport system substrate-binding protein